MSAPTPFYLPLSRRRLLQSLALASAGFMVPGAFAEALKITPRLTEGTFYPDKLPLDQDNDLIRISNEVTPALGTITNLSGRVVDTSGTPIKGALVELWQADDHGVYIHSREASRPERDLHFQGYGKFETASDGGYRFRTIKPGLYTGRTRHYHFGITLPGQRRYTTQLFFAGEPGNERDGVLRVVRDPALRALLIREFTPVAGTGELATTWDIVMGRTPVEEEGEEHQHRPPPPPAGSKDGRGPGRPPEDRPRSAAEEA